MNYAETLNHKLLSKDEEYALISDVQNNTAKAPASRDILILNNMKLIYKSCVAWASKYDHVEADELVYDPSQNCRTFFEKKSQGYTCKPLMPN